MTTEVRVSKSFNRILMGEETCPNVVVNFGITGCSGTGKSSFINAARGIRDDDRTAAPVGVTETTSKPTCYVHDHNSGVRFWDVPGMGTPSHPSDVEKYCEEVDLEKYDAYLIFASSRFTENDRRLAKMIRTFDKPLFFIRTKVDADLRAEKRKRSFDEDSALSEIRRDCVANLADVVPKENVYLISNHHTTQWDFCKLAQDVFDVHFERRRENLISYIESLSLS